MFGSRQAHRTLGFRSLISMLVGREDRMLYAILVSTLSEGDLWAGSSLVLGRVD